MDEQLAGLLGQGGIAAALIFVIYKVGTAMVEAVKALRTEVADHTKADLAAQRELREDVATLNARIETAMNLTPKPRRAKTNPLGVRLVQDEE